MKKIFLICAMFTCATSAMAAVVTQQQAMEIAQKFLSENGSSSTSTFGPGTTGTFGNPTVGGVSTGKFNPPKLSLSSKALDKNGAVDYYIFNTSDKTGFVIVSGDDRFVPVLGYGDSGSFDTNNIPDGLQYLLGEYQREMAYLKANPNNAVADSETTLTHYVKPLIKVKWNQTAPYNNKCPLVGTERCVTGCVMTAAAQILKYHQWPPHGKGVVSYECNVNGEKNSRTLTADLSKSEYRWDLMDNTYDDSSEKSHCNAVALLMRDLGYANMADYGLEGTGGDNFLMADELVENFYYDENLKLLYQDDYSKEEWEQILFDELDAKRPVYFAGNSKAGNSGHAFVIDGYDAKGRFHVNWGWGGDSNGYFKTSLMRLTKYNFDFRYDQQMIVNIKPRPIEPVFEWKLTSDVMPANRIQTLVTMITHENPYNGRLCMVIFKNEKHSVGNLGKELDGFVTNPITRFPIKPVVFKGDSISLKPFETKHFTITGNISEPVGTHCTIIVCRDDQLSKVMGWISTLPYSTDDCAIWGFNSRSFVVGDPLQKTQDKVDVGVMSLDVINRLINSVLSGAVDAGQNAACDVNGDGVIDNEDITEYVKALLEQR